MKITCVILAILVVVTTYFAWFTTPQNGGADLRQREGELIGIDGKGALDVRELELITWDASVGQSSHFKVVYDNDQGWVIPSHSNYPADAQEQVGRTAGSVLGKHFGHLVSTSPQDFDELGVVDPSDATNAAAADNGQGTRVVLRDADKADIIDIIVGKRNPAKPGTRFVRETGSTAVYTAAIDVVFSTRFTDWVNRKLIDISADDVRSITIDRYNVDESSFTVQNRTTHTLARTGSDADWAVGGAVPAGKVVDTTVVDGMLRRLANLQLQGVRPLVIDEQYLISHGLFHGKNKQLYGNEGSISVVDKRGVTYQLFFGEVAAGTGLALSAGLDNQDAAASEAEEGAEEVGDNRYVAILVDYKPQADEDLAAAIKQAQEAKADDETPAEGDAQPAATDEDTPVDPQAMKEERIAEVTEMGKRFLAYFYVIDNASFYELRPDVETLFTDPPPVEEAAPAAPAPAPVAPTP